MINKKYKKYIPWSVLILIFICTILLNYYVQWRCLDSDMAGEMILANLLNKEGTLISKNWYYSTEVRVFCEQIWFRLGLLISPNNWRIARLIGHSINLAILIISLLFLLYSTSIKEKGIWIAIVLLLPFDFWYLFHIIYGGFYICHTVALFVMLGLFLRYINDNNKLYLLLLFIFGIIFGLNGIKVLMYYTVPCILTSILIIIYKFINKSTIKSSNKFLIIGTFVASLSTIIGAFIYLFAISKVNSSASFNVSWNSFSFVNLIYVIKNYFQSLGYNTSDVFQTNINIFSLEGIMGVFGIINAIVFIVSLVSLFRKKYFDECKDRLLFLFTVCAYITEIIVFTLTKESSNGSYWLPLIPFSLIIVELFLESVKMQNSNTNYLRAILLVSFIFCSFVNNDWYLKNKPRSLGGAHEVANWLQKQECKKIVSKFWEGNTIAEYSNGEIEVYLVEDFEYYSTCTSLQDKRHTVDGLESGEYVVASVYDESEVYFFLENISDVVYEYDELKVYRIK